MSDSKGEEKGQLIGSIMDRARKAAPEKGAGPSEHAWSGAGYSLGGSGDDNGKESDGEAKKRPGIETGAPRKVKCGVNPTLFRSTCVSVDPPNKPPSLLKSALHYSLLFSSSSVPRSFV